jgi:hypothetical protein
MTISVASILDEATNKDIFLNIIVDYRERESGIIDQSKRNGKDFCRKN